MRDRSCAASVVFLFPPGAPLRRGGVKSWGTPPNPRGGRPHFPPATHVRSSRGCPVGPVKVVASLRSAKRGRLATVSNVSEARSVETKQARVRGTSYLLIYNINIWKVNEVQMPSCPSSHRETADMDVGARLLQVTNTCDTAVGGRVQCCDRNSSGRDFLPSFAGLAVLVQISHRGGRRRDVRDEQPPPAVQTSRAAGQEEVCRPSSGCRGHIYNIYRGWPHSTCVAEMGPNSQLAPRSSIVKVSPHPAG